MSQRQDLLDSEISEIDPAEQMRPRIHRFVGPPKHTFEAGDGAEVGTIAAVDVLVELQKGRSLFEVDHHFLLLLTVTVVSDR